MKIKIPPIIQTVAPLWTEKMNKRKTFDELRQECIIRGVHLNIRKYECCIVGEALDLKKRFGGWNMGSNVLKYHNGCNWCHAFSQELHSDIIGGRQISLEVDLERFANHLKKNHRSIIKRKELEH